jgi:hypothetical protein
MDKWIVAGGLSWNLIEGRDKSVGEKGYEIMSDVQEAYKKSQGDIDAACAAYNKSIDKFRSTIRNDLSSISSSAEKVKGECNKMGDAYQRAINTLTSEGMIAAIANAERLATALQAISELQSHSITFAVLDKKPQ